MMTPSNGNIFRVTGHLCGEFTGPGEFPTQRPVTRSFEVFFDLRLNKRLRKQSWGWWFETTSRPLWRQCNAALIRRYWVRIQLGVRYFCLKKLRLFLMTIPQCKMDAVTHAQFKYQLHKQVSNYLIWIWIYFPVRVIYSQWWRQVLHARLWHTHLEQTRG